MRLRRHLSYANLMATAAVFIALGGSAYALGRNSVGSRALKPAAVKSKQIKNRAVKTKKIAPRAVKAGKVRPNTLTGRQINERRLDFGEFVRSGSGGGSCDPTGFEFVSCGEVDIDLPVAGQALIVAAGGQNSVGGPASGECQIRVDGGSGVANANPGETTQNNTGLLAQNGFATTAVAFVAPGPHTYGLACNEREGDQRISQASISVLVIGRP